MLTNQVEVRIHFFIEIHTSIKKDFFRFKKRHQNTQVEKRSTFKTRI